jgi:outer membrane murein-binding lipoprotein Lpp
MMKTLAALCGAALIAGCSSVPVQKVEGNSSCDYALMAKMDAQWQPTLIHRYWVNCPQVRPKS